MLRFNAPAGRPRPLLSNAASEALIASARHELFKLIKKARSVQRIMRLVTLTLL